MVNFYQLFDDLGNIIKLRFAFNFYFTLYQYGVSIYNMEYLNIIIKCGVY